MMLYFFAKKNGNSELVGFDCESLPSEFVVRQTQLSEAGFESSTPEEYEEQVINGARAGMVVAPDVAAVESSQAGEAQSTEASS